MHVACLITPVCSRARLNDCQAESSRGRGVVRELSRSLSQMADPSREEESVTLLGEEGLRAGGQALKLGFVTSIFKDGDHVILLILKLHEAILL